MVVEAEWEDGLVALSQALVALGGAEHVDDATNVGTVFVGNEPMFWFKCPFSSRCRVD
jgi:hypothetical protein